MAMPRANTVIRIDTAVAALLFVLPLAGVGVLCWLLAAELFE
jgi:hypothetical protein